MAVLTAGLERKRLLAVAMGGFAVANLLAALAPGYARLMVARLLLALSAASFMPTAGGYAMITAQQGRLEALAPDLATLSLSLNSSAIYLGSAIGAAGAR